MAETYGFFNSTDNDVRAYSADHLTNLLSMLISNGVCGGSDALRADRNNFNVTISSGGAVIDGHWYFNSAPKVFSVTPPTSGTRFDRIVVRYNQNTRRLALLWRKGTGSDPPEIYDNDQYKEISVCRLMVVTTSIISVTDERVFVQLRN